MKIIEVKNGNEGGEVASKIILEQLKTKKNSVFLFPTGSTPLTMYAELVKKTQTEHYDWSEVVSFNLDEYYDLKPDFQNQSYHYFMFNNFFSTLNIKPTNIHFPYSFLNAVPDVTVYDQEIEQAGGIDLAVLGVGTNGHIAFNEPGTGLESLTHLVDLAWSTRKDNARFFNYQIDDVPTKAVTCGLKTILQAKKILLIVYGVTKQTALEHLLTATNFDPDWPVTALINCDDLTVITDLPITNKK